MGPIMTVENVARRLGSGGTEVVAVKDVSLTAKEENRSVVIVSHDERIKDIADRVLWLEDGQFKDAVRMARNPVCGMSVDQGRASAHTTYQGGVYYFCSRGCRDEFLEDPERFL
jgi:putative ABC transport system ATP-binding protein